ncbi:hypothetical protein D0N73_19255 [Pseudomonas fluorescens]|nr:hypothetical protein D0N73_19255 [Pseudomonas fluorescens]
MLASALAVSNYPVCHPARGRFTCRTGRQQLTTAKRGPRRLDDLDYSQPYTSARSPVMGNNMVACSQPLAAQAGLGQPERAQKTALRSLGVCIDCR